MHKQVLTMACGGSEDRKVKQSYRREKITKISPILLYLIYNGLEKDLDAAMVYERLMGSTETSDMH